VGLLDDALSDQHAAASREQRDRKWQLEYNPVSALHIKGHAPAWINRAVPRPLLRLADLESAHAEVIAEFVTRLRTYPDEGSAAEHWVLAGPDGDTPVALTLRADHGEPGEFAQKWAPAPDVYGRTPAYAVAQEHIQAGVTAYHEALANLQRVGIHCRMTVLDDNVYDARDIGIFFNDDRVYVSSGSLGLNRRSAIDLAQRAAAQLARLGA